MKQITAWIGIDPGLSGAAALIDEFCGLQLFDWPGIREAAGCLCHWRDVFDIQAAVLEGISARPSDDDKHINIAKLIQNFGQWEGLLMGLNIPYLIRTPQQWQKGLIDKRAGDTSKKRSLAAARQLYPCCKLIALEKHHNRADAIMIARHAQAYSRAQVVLINQVAA